MTQDIKQNNNPQKKNDPFNPNPKNKEKQKDIFEDVVRQQWRLLQMLV